MKRTRNHIYPILRTMMALLLLAAMPATAFADCTVTRPATRPANNQDGWEAWTKGSGTKDDPYLIETPGQLVALSWYVAQKAPLEFPIAHTPDGLYFRLTRDLDMGGRVLLPIGNGYNGFNHDFDGNSHTISNFIIDWSDASSNGIYAAEVKYACFGLFGYVTKDAKICNLHIDNALVTRWGETALNVDTRLGVLAGAVASAGTGAIIRNVQITNSKIDGGDKACKVLSLFVGGAIADITNGYADYGNMTGALKLHNIHAHVDIDLSNVLRNPSSEATKFTQFNAGGIIGRLRRPAYTKGNPNTEFPLNTIYEGTVNAPLLTVGPMFGASRSNSDNKQTYDNFLSAFVGQYGKDSAPKIFGADGSYTGLEMATDRHIYFGDYRIIGADNAEHVITESSPAAGQYRARSIADNTVISDFDKASAAAMDRLKGVNAGIYIDGTDVTADAVVALFNYDNNNEGDLQPVVWSHDAGYKMQRKLPGIKAEKDGNVYKAQFTESTTGIDGYSIRWQVIDITGTVQDVVATDYTYDPATGISVLYGSKIESYVIGGLSRVKSVKAIALKGGAEVKTPQGAYVVDYVLMPELDTRDELKIKRNGTGGYNAVVGSRPTNTSEFRDFTEYDAAIQLTTTDWKWEMADLLINEWTELTGENASTLENPDPNKYYRATCTFNYDELSCVIGPKNVVFVRGAKSSTYSPGFTGKDAKGNDFPEGDDKNMGYDPWHPVMTMRRAYELLEPTLEEDKNIVVLMGFVNDEKYLNGEFTDKGLYPFKATVTSKYGVGHDYDGCMQFTPYYYNSSKAIVLEAPLKLENMRMHSVIDEMQIYCHLNDFTVGENVRVSGFKNEVANQGIIEGDAVPALSIVSAFLNPNNPDDFTYPAWNKEPGVCNIELLSGCFGRIIGSSRNTVTNGPGYNVCGSPAKPIRTKILVDIAPGDDGAGNFANNYSPGKDYTHDIGMLVGGQTDGSVYGDMEITLRQGKIGRYVSGNISYGRSMAAGGKPDDSFFGRVVMNMEGGSIDELYGGSLGRHGGNGSTKSQPYFYGTSVINIRGGEIHGDVYGAGAGGVIGIGVNSDRPGIIPHTSDVYIPYMDGTSLKYGNFDLAYDKEADKGKMPTIATPDGTGIDLNNSYVEVNVSGGFIEGNVYGGGYGYAVNLPVARVPFTTIDGQKYAVAGNVYGNCKVTVSGGTIIGNVYGGGAGSNLYDTAPDKPADVDFTKLAQVYGNTTVEISGGVIGVLREDDAEPTNAVQLKMLDHDEVGNVYGGAQGIPGYPEMAAVYGNCSLSITGGTITDDVFAGSAYGSIRNVYPRVESVLVDPATGHVSMEISGGTFGNRIFGGSRGSDGSDGKAETESVIEGGTTILVNDNRLSPPQFLDTPYLNQIDLTNGFRDFNIYGGGYLNCKVERNTYVELHRSLVNSNHLFPHADENPNEWPVDGGPEKNFQRAYMDITYRRCGVYGGGFGEKTQVLNTEVIIDIPTDLLKPHGMALADNPYHGQSFFDVAGGGYAGNVGYWDNSDPDPDKHYETYVGGNCNVTIDGYTYTRKVIGGGFYGSCKTTNTHVRCGSLRQVYGGSLLGYVHDRAYLRIGNEFEDFLNSEYIPGAPEYNGSLKPYTEEQIAEARHLAWKRNRYVYVTENVYGGNDVKGIVGTVKWKSPTGKIGTEAADSAPLWQADVSPSEEKGVVMDLHGGTFMGNVYGAGNGYYRGYYVPEWVRYDDGPARMYTEVTTSLQGADGKTLKEDDGVTPKKGKVYRTRPMVGSVNINIRGNGPVDVETTDMVTFEQNFFGGGRNCTIGQWNTFLPIEDPRRLVKGGHLHINVGGYTDVKGDFYMGSDGGIYKDQTFFPLGDAAGGLAHFNGSTTKELEKLGANAYGHWWYNKQLERYEPGFPPPGVLDGNFNMTGEHMLRGYLKNIEMEGDVELTFYKDLYKRDADGNFVDKADSQGMMRHVRKSWVPGEIAPQAYDAQGVEFTDFYLGGACGSMTNNNVMYYNYDKGEAFPSSEASGEVEKYGSIYRIVLPRGVTVRNAVILGSKDAVTEFRPYADENCSAVKMKSDDEPEDPYYRFDGGIVTQTVMSFDTMVYNKKRRETDPDWQATFDLPDDFYTSADYEDIRTAERYEVTEGDEPVTIYRYLLVPKYSAHVSSDGLTVGDPRYALAVTYAADDQGHTRPIAYMGRREDRPLSTAVKFTGLNKFELMDVDAFTASQLSDGGSGMPEPDLDGATDPDTPIDHHKKTGALVFGGCYNSGVTMGNVIMHVASNMLCDHLNMDQTENFTDLSGLRYNIARVYGGGFGKDTEVRGNTYVGLLSGFRGFNIFGGGLGGDVTGTATVVYLGSEDSYVYGSIYGGGLNGSVGTGYRRFDSEGNLVGCLDSDGNPAEATRIHVVSGNCRHVYGGSCLGDIYGSTNVLVEDDVISEMDHLDFSRVPESMKDIANSRAIVGSVYGGNDIAGTIYTFNDKLPGHGYVASTNVTIDEVPDEEGEGKDSPGSKTEGGKRYNGFPLVGDVYAGSNGNYGLHDGEKYAAGTKVLIHLGAEGENAKELDLSTFDIPTIDRARVDITGGTIISVFGGGNQTTVSEHTHVNVNYGAVDARAGFHNTQENEIHDRIYRVLEMASEEQYEEVLETNNGEETIYKYQIYRLFSGNDNADMAIQPLLSLTKGHVGSVYGGGNVGRMTYYRNEGGVNHGLQMDITSPDIHIEAVYGGGRVGDIVALDADGTRVNFNAGEYGSVLNISAGLIEAVYGGNDVSGQVYNGTNVNITGAISGDVYGAGNGNYLYVFDKTLPVDSRTIYEQYNDAEYGGRYFRVPPRSAYGGASATPEQKIMVVNSYRPNVDKSYLSIAGTADNHVWVKGSVYCGGNSSTIKLDPDNPDNTIKFNIGNYVTLDGVFMGSNGEFLADVADGGMMRRFEHANDLDLTKANELKEGDLPAQDAAAIDAKHYPTLLSLYMRAVEVDGEPDEFDFNITVPKSAYIGTLCYGGNRGSMMTNTTINSTLPELLTIYGNVVGGCKNTMFQYRGTWHTGGMTQFMAKPADPKLHLEVKCAFDPKRLVFDDAGVPSLVEDIDASGIYADDHCNIIGGCYDSGLTVGDIHIDLYSDMLGLHDTSKTQAQLDAELQRLMASNEKMKMVHMVVGAGYGKQTMLVGNTRVTMVPTAGAPDGWHPSCHSIFGGSQQGQMVGNSYLAVHDGTVAGDLFGGSGSAVLYGSTNVVVGYPNVYRTKDKAVYALNRADNEPAHLALTNETTGLPAIKTEVWLAENDYLAQNVYEIATAKDGVTETEDNNRTHWFEPVVLNPEKFDTTWDKIDIRIGINNMYELGRPYYAHGNIYGGGYVSNASDADLARQATVKRFEDYSWDHDHVGYGGNSMIMVGDNPDPASTRDHISIGTARFNKVKLRVGQNKDNKYYYNASAAKPAERFVHQEPRVLGDDEKDYEYYEIEADGGIYGGGRKVYVEAFRGCDLQNYGYAESTPQFPKLLNTLQRFDLLTVRDCCLQLQGALDNASPVLDKLAYSMTRIGEFRMESSLLIDDSLYVGVDETAGKTPAEIDHRVDKPGLLSHNTPKCRNYVGFYSHVRFVGAFYSSTGMDDKYHGSDGTVSSEYAHYREYKEKIAAYRPDDDNTFRTRNVGTAQNMIGLSNGNTLKIQGYYNKLAGESGRVDDGMYYGPVLGVTEVKLLTLLSDEGGGYIYAFNNHESLARDGDDKFTVPGGNFVFPGRVYSESGTSHYILDDCYPQGFDEMTASDADGWKQEDTHYWYVSGSSYYFNAALTAYTFNRAKNFYLNNYDQLIMLSGVKPGADIRIKNVTWEPHTDEPLDDGTEYKCALQYYPDEDNEHQGDYNLFLTVDKYYDKDFRDPEMPESVTTGAFSAAVPRVDYTASADPASDTTADGVKPNDPVGAYNYKFEGETNSPVLGISLHDNIDNSDPEYFRKGLSRPCHVFLDIEAQNGDEAPILYHVALTINYLQGPKITGNIVIDNCALPGEVVLANTGDMEINLSEELSVESRKWILNSAETDEDIDITGYRDMLDFTKLRLPVWYYMNGWNLKYRLTINGEDFDVVPADDAEHRKIEVHNYHRMYAPMGAGTELYQVFTPGCHIYLEDEDDLIRFLALADTLSMAGHEPRTLRGTALKDRPVNCEDLEFFIMKDHMTLLDDYKVPAEFGGRLHGHGLTLESNKNHNLFKRIAPSGGIFNLGYLVGGNTWMVERNDGRIVNCFYYNADHHGGFSSASDDAGEFLNCYKNVNSGDADNEGVSYASEDDFQYGRVAYNLNMHYLIWRYAQLKGIDVQDDDLPHHFHDGSYRYAQADPFHIGTPTALRTQPRPNYMGFGTATPTYHNMNHPEDEARHHVETETIDGVEQVVDEYYLPLYPQDALMFGQDLTTYSTETHPSKYNGTNRVYRASGFYGTKQDRGVHFNADVALRRPTLTAVDFTGFRDFGKEPDLADTEDDLNKVHCVPMLDLPEGGFKSWYVRSNASMLNQDAITRNLLVYAPVEMAEDVRTRIYTDRTLERNITGHFIYGTPEDGYQAYGGIFHLVDLQNLNVPIEFKVTKRAWYERMPERFASNNDAWDGLCLPFTVNRVSAYTAYDPDLENEGHTTSDAQDRGEISHFYGDVPTNTTDVDRHSLQHEYWLRSLVGYDDAKGLEFVRPGMASKPFLNSAEAPVSQLAADYHYSNTWFSATYGTPYIEDFNNYKEAGVDFDDYRFITEGVPYIVSYPGKRYKEFDFSGEFYYERKGGNKAYPMTVCYEYLCGDNRTNVATYEYTYVADAANAELTIRVSDDVDKCVRARGTDYRLMGTYSNLHIGSSSEAGLNDTGTAFSSDEDDVLPFRVYLSAAGSMYHAKPIWHPADEVTLPGEDEPDGDDEEQGLYVTVEDGDIVVYSDHDCELVLYDIDGRVVDYLSVEPGENRFGGYDRGIYITASTKLLLK